MAHIHQELEKIGLNGSEIRVYLFLLENGISTPSQIAKGTGIGRTNTYHLLNALGDMKLVDRQERGKRYVYLAGDPSATLRVLERRKASMEAILPELEGLYKNQKNKPVIQFFEGPDGLKELYMKSIEAKEEIHAIGSTEKMEKALPGFNKKFQVAIKRKGLLLNDLLTTAAKGKTAVMIKETIGGLYSQKFLPDDCGDTPSDILIWDDSIALITLEEPLFGTLIRSKPLADTFRTLFGLAWRVSEK